MSEAFKNAMRTNGVKVSDIVRVSGVSRATVEKVEKSVPIRYAYAANIVKALNEIASTGYTVENLDIATVNR